MKIALYEASDEGRQDRVFYPLGLGYLASYVKKSCSDVEIRVFRNLADLLEFRPRLAGVSCVSPHYPRAVRVCDTIKRQCGSRVILGGVHITSVPGSLPESCTAGVLGEGEKTFQELAELYQEVKTPGEADLAQLPGLVFRDGEELIRTAPRPLISPLDEIPFPLRDWEGHKPPIHWSITSRGCPYRCAFCSSSFFWNNYRSHSPSYVVEELLSLVNSYHIRFHTFMDDLFVSGRERVRETARLVAERLPFTPDFTITIRADLVDGELSRMLREMGVRYAHLGLESGSEKILAYLKREKAGVQENQRALEILAEADINPVGSFILGAPGETREDLEATYRFIEKNLSSGCLRSFTYGPLVAFPGTKIWDYAVKSGRINPRAMDWESLDIDLRYFDRDRYLLLNDEMSREEFFSYFDRFDGLMKAAREKMAKDLAINAESPG